MSGVQAGIPLGSQGLKAGTQDGGHGCHDSHPVTLAPLFPITHVRLCVFHQVTKTLKHRQITQEVVGQGQLFPSVLLGKKPKME